MIVSARVTLRKRERNIQGCAPSVGGTARLAIKFYCYCTCHEPRAPRVVSLVPFIHFVPAEELLVQPPSTRKRGNPSQSFSKRAALFSLSPHNKDLRNACDKSLYICPPPRHTMTAQTARLENRVSLCQAERKTGSSCTLSKTGEHVPSFGRCSTKCVEAFAEQRRRLTGLKTINALVLSQVLEPHAIFLIPCRII